jgi:arylsulfatase A-like enzyme
MTRTACLCRCAILVLPLFFFGCDESGIESPERWNVLVITTDTLRADRLGFYGYPKPTSPFLDRLASESVVFERAVSSSAVTPVSHASIFTGLFPHHHGLRSLHGGVGYSLPKDVPTLATLLSDEGYATGGFVSAFPATRHYGLHQGFDHWDEDFRGNSDQPVLTGEGFVNTGRAQRAGDETTSSCLRWLNDEVGSPFFAWVHYFDVHDSLIRPPDEFLSPFPPTSQKRTDVMSAIYDGETRFIDSQISRLVKWLEDRGLRDKTLILIISDHGEGLGDHGWWGHAILYEEQIRLPFLMWAPGLDPRRIGSTVRSIDVLPTVLDYLGIGPRPGLDGMSVRPLIEGDEPEPRMTYSESINDLSGYQNLQEKGASIYALSEGPWKLIVWREKRSDLSVELFHLEKDPREQRNVAIQEVEVRDRMRTKLESLGSILDDPPKVELDEATKARLEALGYIK